MQREATEHGAGATESVLVGTCNWADHEDFYPPRTKPTDRLAYYARHFRVVEVDSTSSDGNQSFPFGNGGSRAASQDGPPLTPSAASP